MHCKRIEVIPYNSLDHRQEILNTFNKKQLQKVKDYGNCFVFYYNTKGGFKNGTTFF